MICLVNDCPMWRLNNVQVKIGEFWNFLGVNREVLVDPIKEILEEMGAGVVTQECNCGAYNY